ncbi:MAG: hypothetical protein Q9219_006256 [cf. Caloplaca sp. 3 TL-2023]
MSAQPKPVVILVHGAWHVPQHYQSFITELEKAGFQVSCPLLPTCDERKRLTAGMYEDAAVIRDIVQSWVDNSREVIMLLHSYGGAPGTEAVKGMSLKERESRGLAGGVIRLIYMCAFMLQKGQSVGAAHLPRPVPDPIGRDDATGLTSIIEPRVPLLYEDVEPHNARQMENLLVPQSGRAMTDTITYPAWQHVPTTFVKTRCDKILFPSWQDQQIKAVQDAGFSVEVTELESSHSPFLSMPDKMLAVVQGAVKQRANL